MSSNKYPADWNKRRVTLFNRYDWECQDCGETVQRDSERELHAHHVRPISEGGGHGLDNLLPLCRSCHQRIHEGDMERDLHPQKRYNCVTCEISYIDGTGFRGSFCSEYCWLTHKAEKQLVALNDDNTICSTCFSDFPRSAEVCPNCDNWDSKEDHRDTLENADVDVLNLIRGVLRQQHRD